MVTKNTIAGVVGIGVTLYFGAWGYSELKERKEQRQRSELIIKVSEMADMNKNGTSSEEWAQAYHEMGKKYDVHTANPLKDLPIEDLQKYIASHH